MSRDSYFCTLAPMTDSADMFIRIGFCPGVVRLTNLYSGKRYIWSWPAHGHNAGAASSGGIAIDTTGGAALGTTDGIALITMGDHQENITSDPSSVDATQWIDVDGIKIASSMDLLESDQLLMIEAWRQHFTILKAYHDGTTSNNTYFEDSSYDFKELGVSGNCEWILYNQSNGNYAFIKEVRKPNNTTGSKKFSRLYLARDREGTATSAADIDTNDVCFIFPVSQAAYPLSDIGLMT